MTSYQIDSNDQEILLTHNNQQIMMEWEKPYMEECINVLKPKGDVLEIGFGCGYSATQIMKYCPKSYTIIECDDLVLEKLKEWCKNYPNIPIKIIKGRWENEIHKLGKFDEIFMDDFPLNITKESTKLDVLKSKNRLSNFMDICIQNHTKINSRISAYLNSTTSVEFSSDTEPFVETFYKNMDIEVPKNCKYRNVKEQKCLIPLIVKTKEYDFSVANNFAKQQLKISKLSDKCFIHENFLTDEECEKLKNHDETKKIKDEIRNIEVYPTNNNLIKKKIQKLFNYYLGDNEMENRNFITIYKKGCYMKTHTDTFKKDGERHCFAITIQLSNPNDYEGGTLVIDTKEIPKKKGTAIFYNSWEQLHLVTEITKGERYSLTEISCLK